MLTPVRFESSHRDRGRQPVARPIGEIDASRWTRGMPTVRRRCTVVSLSASNLLESLSPVLGVLEVDIWLGFFL